MTTELQVSYRNGKPYAAYLYLPRNSGDKAVQTKMVDCGLVMDFVADSPPIRIEITSPSRFTLELLNRLMVSLNLSPADASDVAPLVAA